MPPASPRRFQFALVTGQSVLAGVVLVSGVLAGWYFLDPLGGGPRSGALYVSLFIAPLVVMTVLAALLGEALERARARARTLEEDNQLLQELVTIDSLTGLRNRRYFQQRLIEECARSDRTAQPLALILLDLDHFKDVNDTWGHQRGDEVLVHATRLLVGAIRTCDVACRVGGEEFVVLCPSAREEQAQRVAERVRQSMERTPLLVKGGQVVITGSFGLAVREPDGSTEVLIRQADTALYRAKAMGRNRVEVASEGPSTPVPPRPGHSAR